jgi:hypothetical protein
VVGSSVPSYLEKFNLATFGKELPDGILPYLGSRGTCRIALTFSLKWLELDGKEQPISLPFFW